MIINISNYAPVLITTLNRHIHFKRCVESLAACHGADQTDLFIGFDYPANENHWAGYEIIKAYLPTIKGFKTVNVSVRTVNFGPEKNFFAVIDQIFEKYDRMIISEDDNVFAPSFLAYINKGLEVYAKREDIFSVCGYNLPVLMSNKYKKDIFIWQYFSAWGAGLWKEKWEKVKWEQDIVINDLKQLLSDKKQVGRLNSIANNIIPGLIRIVETGHITGDTLICYHLFADNMYCIFPSVSMVRNTGHDGSGVHGGTIMTDEYRNQHIHNGNGNLEMPFNIKPEKIVEKVLYNHFKISNKTKIKAYIKQNLGLKLTLKVQKILNFKVEVKQ